MVFFGAKQLAHDVKPQRVPSVDGATFSSEAGNSNSLLDREVVGVLLGGRKLRRIFCNRNEEKQLTARGREDGPG
ncbi:hypothetical protein GUJ93_ZPchr0009g695 [Zizania palustris]|uniref:Uncharacterized protein n=1 Tax=Zizania palustris TaxID=103762 RepID=A0A8J5UZ69_ZIZPA|nr:hypothetical protein GUJ93_ZPchr0009g695 [Zizania palustris]